MSEDPHALARRWLGRSLLAVAPALRSLADDPALSEPLLPVAGYAPPAPPTRAELHDAAAVIERAASCLRHAAAGAIWLPAPCGRGGHLTDEHPASVAFAARIACEVLERARTSGDHEYGDVVEAGMARAVGEIWTAGGPVLRQSILDHVTREGGA